MFVDINGNKAFIVRKIEDYFLEISLCCHAGSYDVLWLPLIRHNPLYTDDTAPQFLLN